MNEDKSKGIIKHLHIRRLDDSTYHLTSTTDKGHTQETSHEDAKDLMRHLKDNLTSPHLPDLGSGKRFDNLSSELSRNGASNPDALAAWIGRKKYGSTKFGTLARNGK